MPDADLAAVRHRPGLDGVRGMAVAVVVAYHLGHLRGGFLGVDVFFVLSGYLITGLLLAEAGRTDRVALGAFWGRRLRRLVPALVAMVVTVVAAAMWLGWPLDERRALALDGTATLTWWANWRQAGGSSYWDAGDHLLRHAWSLSIEEQFYVLWPLVVLATIATLGWLVGRRRRAGRGAPGLPLTLAAVALALATLSAGWLTVLSSRLPDDELSRAYVGTDTRVLAPLLGCALAALVAARPGWFTGRTWVRAAGIVGAVVLGAMVVGTEVGDPALYRRGGFVVAALAAGAVVLAAAGAGLDDRDPVAWATTRRPLRHLGLRSYAIYLWSWPIQVLLTFRWPEAPRWAVTTITVVLTLTIAEASHRWVEDPMRRGTGWAVAPARRRPAWALGAVASVAVVVLATATAIPPRAHEQIETAEAAEAALRPAEGSDAGIDRDGLDVLLVGDSVAWGAGFYRPPDDDLPEGIASIRSRAIVACGVLSATGIAYRQDAGEGVFSSPDPDCDQLPRALDLGLAGEPDVVVTMPGAWEWSDVRLPDGRILEARSEEMAARIGDELVAQIGAAHAVGARFVAVEWACPGPRSAAVRRDRAYVRWFGRVLRDAVARGAREHGADATVVEATEEVCVDADPLGRQTAARAAATGDEFHLTSPEGGRWLWWRWLAPALVAAR